MYLEERKITDLCSELGDFFGHASEIQRFRVNSVFIEVDGCGLAQRVGLCSPGSKVRCVKEEKLSVL